MAMYSAGRFENALVEFHKAKRMRPITLYEEWIGRCEETIKAFLTATKIDCEIVEKLLKDDKSKNWLEILTVSQDDYPEETHIMKKKTLENIAIKKAIETKKKNERKKDWIIDGQAA